jgi:hypothetical protein
VRVQTFNSLVLLQFGPGVKFVLSWQICIKNTDAQKDKSYLQKFSKQVEKLSMIKKLSKMLFLGLLTTALRLINLRLNIQPT